MDKAGELDALIARMVDDYLARNTAARTLRDALVEAGVGFWPVMDHLTIRTNDIDRRARQFEDLGYVYSETLEFEDWYAKVYRLAGYPAMFVDPAYQGERGKTSLIPAWVAAFGDNTFHHIAVRVEDIEQTIRSLEARSVSFAGSIIGERGGDLRQIFSVPQMVDGKAFSVLELTERHRGYMGFSPPPGGRAHEVQRTRYLTARPAVTLPPAPPGASPAPGRSAEPRLGTAPAR